MSGEVLQSGNITPGLLAAWATDGVIQDAGVTFTNTYGLFSYTKQQINFNSTNTDNPLLINLPAGYTRYRVSMIVISNASQTLTTATCGVFTQSGALGTAIVTTGSAITVSQSAADTINNMQLLSVNNQNTMSLVDTTLYFRVQIAQGVAATGTVTIFYQPLP